MKVAKFGHTQPLPFDSFSSPTRVAIQVYSVTDEEDEAQTEQARESNGEDVIEAARPEPPVNSAESEMRLESNTTFRLRPTVATSYSGCGAQRRKMRINRGQEFVIGGYTPSDDNFDALIFGYFTSGKLQYVARTRNGFTRISRQQIFKRLRPQEIWHCPFANLPEARSGRWGAGLTAAKKKECRWVKPVFVGQFECTEWTPDNHLRHSRFVGLKEQR